MVATMRGWISMHESKIHVYDNVMAPHDARFVNDIISDKEFLWHYNYGSGSR